jgi:cystathionine beta-lyase
LAPDVVAGLENCIDALTTPGDAIAVQTPAYPPFLTAILQANRNLVTIPLTQGEIDFDELEARLRLSRARVFILCNPHNPTGRVFSRAELGQLAAITARHQVLVVSDEIHGDLVYPGHEFVPFASLGAEVGERTITLTSASKTFNIAGLRLALCIVADRHLRERLLALPQSRWSVYGVLGVRATLAAWSCAGAKWHASLLSHLQRLRSLSERLVSRHLPEVGYRAPQASYLAWLDFRAMQLPQEPAEFFLREAKVALSAGLDFGSEGSGRARLNFATSESLLGEIFGRLAQASERRSVVPSSIASPE